MDGQATQELRIIKKVNQAISYAPDVERVASAILDILITEIGAANASIMMPADTNGHLEIRAARGSGDQAAACSEKSLGETFCVGEGIAGQVARELRPVIIRDTARASDFVCRDSQVKVGSLLSLPLVYGKDELVGVLNLSHPESEKFNDQAIGLLEHVLPPVALALRNARAMGTVAAMNASLRSELSVADRALSEFGRNILRVFNYMSIGVLTVDASARITALNKKAADLLGLGEGDSLADLLGDVVVGRFAPDMYDMAMDLHHGEYVLQIELSALPFKPDWQVLVCIRDVTLDSRPEGPVLAHYREMMSSAVDAMYLVKEGRFVLVNSKFAEVMGYALNEIIGSDFQRFVHEQSHEVLREALNVRAKRGDGSELWLDISVGPVVVDGEGCYAGVIRDVTARRKMLDLRARFLNVASHEIRVPLTVIRGYARMLAKNREGGLSADQLECVAEINSQSERLLDFSNALLDFARIQDGRLSIKRSRINLGDHVATIVRNLNIGAAEKDVRISFERRDEVDRIMADPIRIEQALVNLIDNAVKHAPEGSEVRVVMEKGEDSGRDLRTFLNQTNVVITVMDAGAGIAKKDAARIFEEFYTGDSGTKLEGTGLGLAITREIVQAHGGRVEALASRKGGIFKITMPLNT